MDGRSVQFSTPQTEGCRRRNHAQTPRQSQSRHWRTHTPMRRTPYSRRVAGLAASSTRGQADMEVVEEVEETGPKSLVNKTWRVHEVSPLYRFSQQPRNLKLYGRSLTGFLSNKSHGCECGSLKVAFSTLTDMKSQPEDPECIVVTVSGVRMDGGGAGRVDVLVAVLCGVGVAETVEVAGKFSCLPVLLTRGAAQLTQHLLAWLESHFDCHTTPLVLTPVTLTWMAAMWGPPASETRGAKPMELVYEFPREIRGLDRVTYEVQPDSCRRLWNRIHPREGGEEEVTNEEVAAFIKSLEKHFHSCFHILLSRLTLHQVGTSAVQAAVSGHIKMLRADRVRQVLRFLCEVAIERLFA